MATKYVVTLTEAQYQTLGFTLTLAKRRRVAEAETLIGNARDNVREHVARIDELRILLDTCPITQD